MSNGTHDWDRKAPSLWPTDPAARAALDDWGAGGPEAHLYATEADFSGADLNHLDFFYFYGPGCRFKRTILRGAGLGGSFLPECDFSDADLRQAEFAKAELTNSVFDRADMTSVNLKGAQMEGSSFVDSVLRDAAIGGSLRRCVFVRTDLRRTHFIAPDARGADLTAVDIEGSWGEILGPVWVSVDSRTVEISGHEADSWFRARGANVTVLTVD